RAHPLHVRPALMPDQLRIPGPTPLPERVVRAMSQAMIDHRGPEFSAMHKEIAAGVREVFGTAEADLLILSSSGTGSMESAVANLGSPGDKVVVDAISSASSMALQMDAWGLDVVLSGSQKGWMAPPGIAFAAVAPRAWEAVERSSSPRYYFDWKSHRTWAEKGFTPSTPAVSTLFAVREGVRMLREEGLENVYERHRRI